MQTPENTSADRVRILIVGAAGVGKTTILRKICSETDTPIVHDAKGQEIYQPASLEPTTERGLHDINHEITYPSRPGFIFHDSRGLESGTVKELDEIREFLVRRARNEKDAVHVIWYCVSANSCRPLVSAERQFFERDRGKVPVIVIFTKLDGLVAKAFSDLKREGLVGADAHRGAPARADQLLQTHFIKPIMEMDHPPVGYVTFKGLHKPGGQCVELTRKTVKALEHHDQNLQAMFVFAAKYDLESRLTAALKWVWENGKGDTDEDTIKKILIYFPHVWHTNWAVDLLLRDVRISSFSSLIAGAVLPSQQVTAPVQRLSMIAGTCIIVDICSWSFEGTPASGKSQAELLSALQHALISYQQQKKDLVIQSISQMPKRWRDKDTLLDLQQLILQHRQSSSVIKPQAL